MTAQAISTASETLTMQANATGTSTFRKWTGRILSALLVLFLVMDGVMKLLKPPAVVQGTVQLGYPESTIAGIGIALLLCTALYVIPRTRLLGAILLTGYLGGAVASNVRAGTPMFNVVFPILFAAIVWATLILGDKRLERVFRGRRGPAEV